ncbi:DUF6241 domain-containing protein [Neobacillus sp. 3P2-tot-E-2]|uniref:DUF6241 domain-containing protein n=1 Tax=Neobacillus sp. 3P2-tot-E-2 TaxID=3132212 RepID=UPI0039A0F2CE
MSFIVLAGVVLASAGMIGFNFYQETENEAVVETQRQVEKEETKDASGVVETKVISAEMNPTQENIEAAQEAVDSLTESEEKRKLSHRITIVIEEFIRNLKAKEETRLAELQGDINQAKVALGIDQAPSEKDVLEILHNMTHQKVRSEEKWGFVHINEVNLLAVKNVLLENPSFNQNIDMLSIVTDWLNNDFSNIVAEHNSIWKMKNGSVGKAYGILSPSEEATLVKEQFGVQQ